MRLTYFYILAFLFLSANNAMAAGEAIYGLESVKIENVFDPNARPERLRLVSGSLKLVGGAARGNVWKAELYVPHRAAAPKSDHGIFWVANDQLYLYSLISFSSYTATLAQEGERLVIKKFNSRGEAQTEVWYFVR
ncbi:MAG TPA: hypothetical protein DIU35_19220 [Candidatus Latescibacteria bacterium]|nr:hypothetical protein [Gemmatimonadota bacterium]HCR19612.1 hypothetical protein [Candidatus Latescibacterota bacterium]